MVDPRQCREFLRRREAQRQAALDGRFAVAWREFRAVLDLLRAKYRPRRVYQWGSLLDRRRFWERSDIDIAVEGVTDAATFFALYGDADRLTSLPLDLVALERLEPEFAELIKSKGVLVYDAAAEA